jgi:hypothetical protein
LAFTAAQATLRCVYGGKHTKTVNSSRKRASETIRTDCWFRILFALGRASVECRPLTVPNQDHNYPQAAPGRLANYRKLSALDVTLGSEQQDQSIDLRNPPNDGTARNFIASDRSMPVPRSCLRVEPYKLRCREKQAAAGFPIRDDSQTKAYIENGHSI